MVYLWFEESEFQKEKKNTSDTSNLFRFWMQIKAIFIAVEEKDQWVTKDPPYQRHAEMSPYQGLKFEKVLVEPNPRA